MVPLDQLDILARPVMQVLYQDQLGPLAHQMVQQDLLVNPLLVQLVQLVLQVQYLVPRAQLAQLEEVQVEIVQQVQLAQLAQLAQ